MRLLYLFISRKAISLAPIAFPAGAAMFASMRYSPSCQSHADVGRRRNFAFARRNSRTERPHVRKMVKTKDPDHIQSNLIIAAVRDRPCLFDSNHPNNGDRAEKARSWDEVYASVIPGYGALEMAEKFAAGMLIRWLFADAWAGACGGRAAASRRRPVSGAAAETCRACSLSGYTVRALSKLNKRTAYDCIVNRHVVCSLRHFIKAI